MENTEGEILNEVINFDPEALEVFNKVVLNQDKLRVLMVVSGKARVQDFHIGNKTIFMPNGEFEERTVDQKIQAQIIQVIQSTGLFVEKKDDSGDIPGARIYYAKDKEDLDRLMSLHEYPVKDQHYHKELGMLYGFPETAIEAFANECISNDDLPEEIREHRYFHNFLGFRLSKKHFREEWQAFVEEIDELGRDYPELVKKFGLEKIISNN